MPSGVPILKTRVFAPENAGPKCLRAHAMPSRHDYKTPYYVSSAEDSNFRLALFQRKGEFSKMLENSLSWAQEHKKSGYVPLHEREGFLGYVMKGAMALVYTQGHPEELRALSPTELRKRLYKVISFEKDGRIIFQHHAEARASTVLRQYLGTLENRNPKGESRISLDLPFELLRLAPGVYQTQVLFEGIHFQMMFDGSIRFLEPRQA